MPEAAGRSLARDLPDSVRMKRLLSTSFFVLFTCFVAAGCHHDGPSVSVVRPDDGSQIRLSSDLRLTLVISAEGVTLEPLGACGGAAGCAVAALNIDGDACNEPGKPYNSVLDAGSLGHDFYIDAHFDRCPAARRAGRHEITISLRRDGHELRAGERTRLSVVTSI